MYVGNNTDFRAGCGLIHEFEKIAPHIDADHKAGFSKSLAALKRDVRRYAHREIDYDRRIIKEYGIDGYVELVHMPDDFKDVAQAEEFFERFMTYRPAPSMYDCTGRAFTNWFKVFKRNGGFYAYHSVCMDV